MSLYSEMRRKKQVNRLISSVIVSLVAFSALSQSNNGRPTLIVGITIDQLRSDYLQLLQSHFGANGFNRLINNGVYIENAIVDIADANKVTATALIYTGAYPNINGISDELIYNDEQHTATGIFTDKKFIGNTTNETFSPMALKVSTLSDEVRIDNNGIGCVYAIAPDAQQAIVMAGHAANGAFWINDENGKWASTTFYKEFPSAVQTKNFTAPLSARIDTLTWSPLLSIDKYPDIPLHRTFYPFKYTFSGNDKYHKFKQSALVNSEVTSVAVDCINEMRLGRRSCVDMINIAYTAAPYQFASDADKRIELQDEYIRLDKELSRLFEAVDKAVGKNAFIFVVPTGYFDSTFAIDPRFNVPTGEFSSKKAVSLLNMYLMAVYGNGNWVNGYFNKCIYLNEKLAKDKNIAIEELREKSGAFLRRMSGVNEAYTIDEILNNPTGNDPELLHKSIYHPTSGDIYLEIAPGWTINDDFNTSCKSSKQIQYNAVNAPAFILAPELAPQKLTAPIDASLLAPTVARLLRIRSPNAAKGMPLSLK